MISPRRHKGFTLAEFALVLGMSAVLIAAVVGYGVSARSASSEQALRDELSIVTTTAAQMLAAGAARAEVTTAAVWGSRSIPESMKRAGPILASSAPGQFAVTATTATGSGWDVTQVQMSAVPAELCTPLVLASQDRYDEIQINGTSVKNTTGANTTLPTQATVSTECNGALRSTINFRMVH